MNTKFILPYLWPYNRKNIHLQDGAHGIIHQTLAYGTMDDVKKLLRLYGKDKVKKEFQKPAKGLYHPEILNFCQFLLGVKKLDKKKYLKNIHG